MAAVIPPRPLSSSNRTKKPSEAIRYYPSYCKDTLSFARKKAPLIPHARPATTSKYAYSGLLCAQPQLGRRPHPDSNYLSTHLSTEKHNVLHQRKSSGHMQTCPTCYPSASHVRPSDAVGLDPSSTLARRLTYSSGARYKMDPLPPKLREYFMYKSQSYTWRRVRLMREIKAYLASNVSIAPEYKILGCENVQSHAQIAQDITLDDDPNDDWLKSDLAKVMSPTHN